jgi:N-acetylglucosamine-6-phosphate deacetylase
MLALHGRHFLTGEARRFLLDGGQIRAVDVPSDGREVLGGEDYWVAPGLVDIQVNGYRGRSFCTPDVTVRDVEAITEDLLQAGVTAFCPTVTTASFESLAASMRAIAQACETNDTVRDRILSIHMEGPYISSEDGPRGAHPLRYVRNPDWDEFVRLQVAAGGRIGMVTMAPELPGALEFIERAAKAGIVVALGHHKANRQQIQAAIDAGAVTCTHLGNGCHALLPRHENYVWEQMANDALLASIIVDGHHLTPALVKTICRAKGTQRLILISDAVAAAGTPPGRYRVAEADIEVKEDGSVHLVGTPYLAGSGLKLCEAVDKVMRMAGVSFGEAIQMAACNPARLMGRAPERGNLRVGARGDVTLFRIVPGGVQLAATIAGGRVCYPAPPNSTGTLPNVRD